MNIHAVIENVSLRLLPDFDSAQDYCSFLKGGFNPIKIEMGYLVQNDYEIDDGFGSLSKYIERDTSFKDELNLQIDSCRE